MAQKSGTEKYHRKVAQKSITEIITENYERKLLSPSISSRQNMLTYRNTSYLKTSLTPK